MEPTTIRELDEWMTKNCFNDSYGIGDRNIHEGFGLDTFGSLYVWYYTERGKRQNLNYFQTEKEAVAFALAAIASDRFANRHMIGFVAGENTVAELLSELTRREVSYWKDQIPYGGLHDLRTRVFVFGCDINKVLDLREKYGIQN